ncbi:MAG: hypothetical protein KC519_10120, partial [Anaerolineae bacterium]|nr:hypothetical protein [Anaerolineae bacterium]
QAVVPQMVGRQEFGRLRRAFPRVLLVLGVGGICAYGVFALLAGEVIPPILGDQWAPAIPAVTALAVMGIVTTLGGVFGPLYRALNIMWRIISIKVVSLALGLPVGYWLISQWGAGGSPTTMITMQPYSALIESYAARNGAWTINLIFLISVLLTAIVALRELWRRR